MKHLIGGILFIVWGIVLLVIGTTDSVGEVNVDAPSWTGWAFCILFLATPFISVNLMNPKK